VAWIRSSPKRLRKLAVFGCPSCRGNGKNMCLSLLVDLLKPLHWTTSLLLSWNLAWAPKESPGMVETEQSFHTDGTSRVAADSAQLDFTSRTLVWKQIFAGKPPILVVNIIQWQTLCCLKQRQ
jgi:hypothetical protein